MRKIQTANQNQPHVIHFPLNNLLSHPPAAPLALVGACGTRVSIHKQKCAKCLSVSAFNMVELINLLSLPHHFSFIFNTLLQWFNMFSLAFDNPIALGLSVCILKIEHK